VFTSARQATNAAIDAQRALAAHDWPAGEQVKVRMGANAGEALVGGRDYTGLGSSDGTHRGCGGQAAASTAAAK
jgi:class 3 adenylate cyclase